MSANYNRIMHHVSGRLSLRPPQAESLARLVQALTAAPEMLGKERDAPGFKIGRASCRERV